MSGDVIRNAVMDLRRIALRRPKRRGRAVALSVTRPITASAIARLFAIAWLLEAEGPRTAVAGLRLDPTSRAQEAFDLVLGPGQRLLHRLALEVAHRHLGHDALDVDLHRDLRRGRGPGDRQALVILWVGIMIQCSLRRLFLRPGFKGGEIGERRQVVAAACSHQLFDCRRLREMHQQAFCRILVLAERPDSPEIGDAGCKPALRARGHAVGPALFGDLRRIAPGNRPGAWRTGSDFTVTLPLASTSMAPNEWKIAPAVSTESGVVPSPMPNGKPAFWHASAALRNASSVQFSAFGGAPAGYMACTSMPACCFIRSMREHGPLIWLPIVAGTAIQRPWDLPRYSTVALTAPFCLISGSTMSSTGSSWLAWSDGSQVERARMSWPDLAWASAAIVSKSFCPWVGM